MKKWMHFSAVFSIVRHFLGSFWIVDFGKKEVAMVRTTETGKRTELGMLEQPIKATMLGNKSWSEEFDHLLCWHTQESKTVKHQTPPAHHPAPWNAVLMKEGYVRMSAGTISLLKEPQHMAPAVLLILESRGEREVDVRCGRLLDTESEQRKLS